MEPRVAILLMISMFIVLVIIELFFEHSLRSLRRKHADEFARAFPGQCHVCSYHAFLLREGLIEQGEAVGKHFCIQQNKEIGE